MALHVRAPRGRVQLVNEAEPGVCQARCAVPAASSVALAVK